MKYLSKLSLVLTVGCAAQSVNPAPAVAPAVVAAAKPVVRAPKAPVPLIDYFRILHTANASFNRDETLVAYQTSSRGRNDIAVQPVGGGAPRLITDAKGFINSFGFSPTQDQLVFGADKLGDELTQLYLTDSMGSEPLRLFADDPKGTRADFVRWAESSSADSSYCPWATICMRISPRLLQANLARMRLQNGQACNANYTI